MVRRSRIPQATARAFGAFAVLILATGVAAGASGVIAFRVRDSRTGYAVNTATVRVEAEAGQFATLSLRTDDLGRLRRELRAGRYLFEFSAPRFEQQRTYYDIRSGITVPVTVWLAPESPPEELKPEVLESKLLPGHNLMHGYIVDADTLKPLANVRIRFQKAQVETRTDERGFFWVNVPAPSENAEGLPGTDTLLAELPGYKKYVIENTFVSAGSWTRFLLDLERGSGTTERDDMHKSLFGVRVRGT